MIAYANVLALGMVDVIARNTDTTLIVAKHDNWRLYMLSVERHDDIIRSKSRIDDADGITEARKSADTFDDDRHIPKLYRTHTPTAAPCRHLIHNKQVPTTLPDNTIKNYSKECSKAANFVSNKENMYQLTFDGDHRSNIIECYRRLFTYERIDCFVKTGRAMAK
ncbi:hypothetical protein EVAR_25105_1 [Eumeta japonica]|uniref:Uncharacterized protein n=1 Tax=Eumeta variegata TaxID=151549 RepID=A0A4C1ZPY6_EUMVA|nr:hypothetical protein EVAR_25105_1 [Eumeta japonica]